MGTRRLNKNFWRGKRVLVTGHTGFKGAWLCHWLLNMGADVNGFALPPQTEPNLYALLKLEQRMHSTIGDLRNRAAIADLVAKVQPDIVLHLAAQALVRPSYADPLATFECNIMGTAHLLEAMRTGHSAQVCLVATTDKVYRNLEQGKAFAEDDPLGGHDPYSASKAATEIVISSYQNSFFADQKPVLISARAGNAIGGGDWSVDRIIPDAIRAWTQDQILDVRRPDAVRPWQHVLEPLFAYLVLCENADEAQSGSYNIGPAPDDALSVGGLIAEAQAHFGAGAVQYGEVESVLHEAGHLRLDASRIADEFGVEPRWSAQEAIGHTMAWYQRFYDGEEAVALCSADIEQFERPHEI